MLLNTKNITVTCLSTCLLPVCRPVSCADASVEAGQVVAVPPHVVKVHLDLCESPEEPDSCFAHYGLHLHHRWHTAVPQGLQRQRLSHRASSLANERFLPCLPNHRQDPVWRVDRDHVGLHGGLRTDNVSDLLHNGPGHRKAAGESLQVHTL